MVKSQRCWWFFERFFFLYFNGWNNLKTVKKDCLNLKFYRISNNLKLLMKLESSQIFKRFKESINILKLDKFDINNFQSKFNWNYLKVFFKLILTFFHFLLQFQNFLSNFHQIIFTKIPQNSFKTLVSLSQVNTRSLFTRCNVTIKQSVKARKIFKVEDHQTFAGF